MGRKEKIKKPFYKKAWFWIIAVIIIAGFAGSGADENPETSNQASNTESIEESKNVEDSKKEKNKVNYDNFMKIEMGQSHEDVIALIGEGEEQTSSEVSGIKTAIYTWNGDGISNMNVTIQNGVVAGKAQVGLKKADSDITLEKYEKVKEGMSYEEVKNILGEGEISSETKMANIKSVIYSYINKGGSNANFTFTNDKLQMKAQFNLK
ncbi:DUF3862 domain-containing protein [Clostridium sp. CCUG 7971]|uniref:DUF3862 domain-containing protein n=1 Tax=Clostridium sp. CCUG 7971 TaxID=2811414 RepID=UPI001ABB3B23|nr:DUF3862 domain-containing protein [Clostridium sp. CCUG 7971]MBO3443079.1 DUF3862 domain-containing protein [Clostridium sp. CCUG 7971]